MPRKTKPIDSGISVCYIMGEDFQGRQFYTLAEEFFRNDSTKKTDLLYKHIRSMEELILHLNSINRKQALSRIEIVVHGNVWSGLSAKIMDGGERAYPKELFKSVVAGELPKLNPSIIDTSTKVNLWGCGIGTNPIMNTALNLCFTDSSGISPRVKASSKFVVFKRDNSSQVRLVKASYWPYFFKRGYRPSDTKIARAMKQQYPESGVNFQSILTQENQDDESSFEESFHIPISWTVIYDDQDKRPRVNTEEEKMAWINSQPGLLKKIKELSIPKDQYHWTVNRIRCLNEIGERVPAIKAIGMSTVVCILQAEV